MGKINNFWSGKRFLMYGFSRDRKSIGRAIYNLLVDSGIELIPVRKDIDEIDGVRMLNGPTEAGGVVDGAFVMLNAKGVPGVLEELAANGIKRAFFQIGAFNAEVRKQAEEMGFDYETGCALTRFDRMGFPHSTHRWAAKTFGGMK